MKKAVLFLLMLIAAGSVYSAGQETAHQKALKKWQEMRFGLFIHWGPVSLKGTEIGWSRGGERRGYKWGSGTEVPVEEYDTLYTRFNPTLLNAKEWVQIARKAGMKYLVFTSRHHDGFSMFDTQAGNYKITSSASPFRRDVVRELADACHQAKFGFGLYYSQPDWHSPDAFTPDRHERYLAYLTAQVKELLTNYGKLDILWFDGLGKAAEEYGGVEINRMARELQPHLLINNRNGLDEDFDTPEQRVGKFQNDRPWESCITICQQWAWKPNDKLKSLQECLQTLISCAGGDGNLLLNVGPMPDGRIEPRQVQRLEEIGAWLKHYGEGIYGTRGGPFKPGTWGASTYKDKNIYVFVFQRPEDGKLVLPALPVKVKKARLLRGGAIPITATQSEMQLFIPEQCKDELIIVLKLQMDGSVPANIL
jgi:alpha-L-fucosidase